MSVKTYTQLLAQLAQNFTQDIGSDDLIDLLDSVYPQVAIKTSIQSVTSSTAVVNDNELFVPIKAGFKYVALAVLFYDGATAGDFRMSWGVPTGASGRHALIAPGTAATTFNDAGVNNQSQPHGTDLPAGALGTGNFAAAIDFLGLTTAPTANDNLVVKWAQNTSNATDTRVNVGSFLIVMPVKV